MKRLLCCVVAVLLLLSGCYSYVDLDNLLYVTSILVDLSDDGTPVFVFEAFKPLRSSAKEANDEERVAYSIQESSVSAAINDLQTLTSAEVTFAHCKVALISMKMMQSGKELYDVFDRRQDFISRTLIGLYDGDQDQYADTAPKEERFSGMFLFDLINSCENISAKGVKLDIKEAINQSLIGDQVNSMPIIKTTDEEIGDTGFQVTGLALVSHGKLIGLLKDDAPTYFNLMLNNNVSSLLDVPNPAQPDKMISLRIMHYDRDAEMEFDGQALRYTLKLDVQTNLSEVQGVLMLDDPMLEQISQELEDMIRKNCQELFQQYKDQKIDVFDIQESFDREYPKYEEMNIIENTDLKMDVHVVINDTNTKWGSK